MGIAEEIRQFESLYEDKVTEIAAVTGSYGIGAGKSGKSQVWTASIKIVAWREGGEDAEIIRNKIGLCWAEEEIDGKQVKKNRQLKENSVIRVQIRKGEYDFMLVSVLDDQYQDPQLNMVLEEELKPVFYEDEILGKFELNKGVDTFEHDISWNGEDGILYIDHDDEMKEAFEAAHTLFAEQERFGRESRVFAAKQLVDQANEWLADGAGVDETADGELDMEEITEEMFQKRLILDTISVYGDGSFEIYYFDDDMFWGHSVIVSGNVDGTWDSAYIAG